MICPLAENQVLRRSYLRLIDQWKRIDRFPEGERKQADLQRWHHAVDQAQEQFAKRSGVHVRLEYDADLPIARYRDQIVDLLVHRQVLVLCGETGSGKSTQLPKLCLEAGLGKTGWIGHTQPRRLAARSIAHRLADELDSTVGAAVGFKVRFNDQTKGDSLIKLMTDGVLLAEIQRDRFLDAYDCIILDEAHERSLNIDLLMAYLQRLLPRRPDLRLIITSATIDAEQYANHFEDALGAAPVVNVEGRGFPVEVRYRGAMSVREAMLDERRESNSLPGSNRGSAVASIAEEDFDSVVQRFCNAIDELLSEGRGDILCFFATEREIRDATKHLRGHLTQRGLHNNIEVLPLYARLTEAEQQRVFQPHRLQRIVLATNVAESSITVPGIRYVIDTGTARISRFAAKSKVQRLPIEPVSQASCNQRSGRCGRLEAGIAIRLYDESDYLARSAFATPEIRRSDLASTIVHIKSLGIEDVEALPWLDPPRPEAVREGMNVLRELSAIDDEERLTETGRKLARWPVNPRVGRILIEAERNGCLNDALIIAAAIETQDPRVRPPEKAQAADEAHQKFRDPNSDFLSYLRIWDFYQKLREQLGRSRLEKALRESFLSMVRIREWADVHRQLLEQCNEMRLSTGKRKLNLAPIDIQGSASADRRQAAIKQQSSRRFQDNSVSEPAMDAPSSDSKKLPEGYQELHQSLLCGLLSNICMLEDVGKYKGAQSLEVNLWPGSGVKQSRPKWIVASELIETTQRYARTVAKIELEWIARCAAHMIKYTFDEPHFSKKQGSALVMRKGTLLGLPVSPKLAVPLAPIDPVLARKLLIEDGLAENELVSRASFWQHNQRFLQEVQQLGDKTRRRDLVVDAFVLADFYRNRIPSSVVDRVTLEKWDRTVSAPGKGSKGTEETLGTTPYLSWEAIAVDVDRNEVAERFPEKLSVGVSQLPLRYRYEPGDQADGVSVLVPGTLVHQLNEERLEWLVPGMLEEKLSCLIKSLPKRLRRQLVPVPDTVRRLLPKLADCERQQLPFWKSLCEILTQDLREAVKQDDFDLSSIPEHLRMRVELVNEKGESVEASRNLVELQQAQAAIAVDLPAASAGPAPQYAWARKAMDNWDIDTLPKSVVEMRGGVRMSRFPTLVVDKGIIRTSIVDHEVLAEQLLRRGVVMLLSKMERREIRSQIQFLPEWSSCTLRLSDRFGGDRLRDLVGDLIARLAFVDTQWHLEQCKPVIRTQVEFDIERLKRIERIAGAAAEVGRWLPKLASANHKVRGLLEKSPSTYQSSVQAIQIQLKALFQDAMVYHWPWCYVREYPRYLEAIAVRLDRLKTVGVSKDLEIDRSVQGYWDEYQSQLAKLQPPATVLKSLPDYVENTAPSGSSQVYATGALQEYRWLMEELRVSLYAQQLGTRVSVSPKRLEKLKQQLG